MNLPRNPTAIVLDGEQRAALAVTRSLLRHGVDVEVASAHKTALAAKSRGVRAVHIYPSPEVSASKFVEWMSKRPDALLLPITDTTTMLANSMGNVEGLAYEKLTDKTSLLSLAGHANVPVPRGSVVSSIDDAIAAAISIGYPVVVKPARSRMLLNDRIFTTSVKIATNAKELENIFQGFFWLQSFPAIIQEFIDGTGAGVFCLFDSDHAISWFAHRRLREKPPTGGVSVLSESAGLDPALRLHAEALLRAARYKGVAMVEFRIARDNRPYLMEVNARFWGSLQLAVDCGIDFPWMYWQILQGVRVDPTNDYLIGRRLRWLLGDLDNLLIQARDQRLTLPERLKVVGRFFRSSLDQKCRQEVMRLSDPVPGLSEAWEWLRSASGRSA